MPSQTSAARLASAPVTVIATSASTRPSTSPAVRPSVQPTCARLRPRSCSSIISPETACHRVWDRMSVGPIAGPAPAYIVPSLPASERQQGASEPQAQARGVNRGGRDDRGAGAGGRACRAWRKHAGGGGAALHAGGAGGGAGPHTRPSASHRGRLDPGAAPRPPARRRKRRGGRRGGPLVGDRGDHAPDRDGELVSAAHGPPSRPA